MKRGQARALCRQLHAIDEGGDGGGRGGARLEGKGSTRRKRQGRETDLVYSGLGSGLLR